jgi:hypothetical protein
VVVFNPGSGGVVTEGGQLLIEESFTDTGGMSIEIPLPGSDYNELAADAEDAAEDAADALIDANALQLDAQMAQLAADAPGADDAALAAAEAAQAAVDKAVDDYLEALAEAEELEAARRAEASTVTVSADGTQQTITDAEGNTATSVTTDTGVIITMDVEPLRSALNNLSEGQLQEVLALDGSTLVVRRMAEGDPLQYYNPDGSDATDVDGDLYTVEDLVAWTLTFED